MSFILLVGERVLPLQLLLHERVLRLQLLNFQLELHHILAVIVLQLLARLRSQDGIPIFLIRFIGRLTEHIRRHWWLGASLLSTIFILKLWRYLLLNLRLTILASFTVVLREQLLLLWRRAVFRISDRMAFIVGDGLLHINIIEIDRA